MKIGAENRTKLIVAIGLMADCRRSVAVQFRRFCSESGGAGASASLRLRLLGPLLRRGRRARLAAKSSAPAARSLDPTLRYDWLKASEDTEYEGKGRNIFMTQAEIPQPVAPAQTPEEIEAAKGPPAPPPPPPINLKFFGFANKPGESKKIFLSEGEDVFIAGEGDVVNRHYKVLRISPTSVEIEDVLNNNRQNIPLTG